ncbi:MAG: endonuclease/exonuclease/phosphatase family protein, partial [Thiohalospira sp.]
MRVASWNVNSLNVRLPHVLAWAEQQRPDLLALQETKLADERFPSQKLFDGGWQEVHSGQKTYNGVAILARGEAHDIVTDLPGLEHPQRRVLAASYG